MPWQQCLHDDAFAMTLSYRCFGSCDHFLLLLVIMVCHPPPPPHYTKTIIGVVHTNRRHNYYCTQIVGVEE